MVQTPIQAMLERALKEFEEHLAAHPVKESPVTRAEKLNGAKLFVRFLLGLPTPIPFTEPSGTKRT